MKKFVLRTSVLLFGLCFGFLGGELLLRMAPPAWLVKEMTALNLARNVTRFGSDVGWSVETIDGRFVRFTPRTQFDVEYFEYKHAVHIDAWGNRTVAKHKDARTVPFLGDSFAFGLGVEDPQTYISLLNDRSPYQFMNLGVPGSCLPNQLDQIVFRHKELGSPKVYVFSFFTGNDYSDIVRYYNKTVAGVEKKDNSARQNAARWLERYVFKHHTFGKSYALQFLKRTLLKGWFYSSDTRNMLLPRSCSLVINQKHLTNVPLILMSGRNMCLKDVRSYVRVALDDLVTLMQQLRFSAVFIIIPDKLQVNTNLRNAKAAAWGLNTGELRVEYPDKIVEDALTERQIPYFDLSRCLAENQNFYYKSDDHLTAAGHAAAADCLNSGLEKTIRSLENRSR